MAAAILMGADEQGIRVEVSDGRARRRAVGRAAEAHQWAVDARWVQEAEAATVLER